MIIYQIENAKHVKSVQVLDNRENIFEYIGNNRDEAASIVDQDNTLSDNVTVTLRNATSTKETKRFKKPTVEEIKEYCIERNNNIDAEQFFNFYESKGWLVGKNSMKDWKASVRTWEKK